MIRDPSTEPDASRTTVYAIAILGTFLITAALVCWMYHYTHPTPLGADRVQERHKNLREQRDAEAKVLTEYDWQDRGKEIVRLPIQRAVELTVQEWQNPAAARSNLIARAEKAAVPAPKPPEKPNIYE